MTDPKGTRLDLDALPDEWARWAMAHAQLQGLDVPIHSVYAWWDEFRDYWVAIPGQRGRKLDWLATWRNNVRKAVDREISRRNRYPGAPRRDLSEPRFAADARRQFEQSRRGH